MKESVIGILACPVHGEKLALSVTAREGEEILEGALRCPSCEAPYRIAGGIPRMIEPGPAPVRGAEKTVKAFSFQWALFDRLGWDDAQFGYGHSKMRFFDSTQFKKGDLSGRRVIDMGCGNGRFARVAAEEPTAEVFAVDLGVETVEAAYRNLRASPNAHVVQASVFQLPFRPGAFDVGYSIGVLHHTGDTRKAFEGLASRVKPGGLLAVDIYHPKNAVCEAVDRSLRAITTRMDSERLCRWSLKLESAAVWLDRHKLLKYVNLFMRLEPSHVAIFDWYSPGIADRHTYAEVEQWFRQAGFEVVKTLQPRPRSFAERFKRRLNPPWALVVQGSKKQP